jgi:hypothetical protein
MLLPLRRPTRITDVLRSQVEEQLWIYEVKELAEAKSGPQLEN